MTEASISAYDKFIIESTEQYLQTVVLVDDRIYESKSGNVALPLTKPPSERRKAALKSATSSANNRGKEIEKKEVPEKPDEVSFHDVQNSYAKKCIICSLYQPTKKSSFGKTSDVYKLCSMADAVIIDWDLHGDSGTKATALVGVLVEQSMLYIPHQLRLILIYTMDDNLGAVANDIYESLAGLLGEQFIEIKNGSEGLVLMTNNSRVVVLGKRPNPSFSQYSEFIVREKDLAQRTINEFSQLASGLLQGIILRGIANLRKNNRRILTRFHHDLDVAFLTHRALLLPEEAFGQIIPLLTDELRAVLEDTVGETPLGQAQTVKEILVDWCDKHWNKSDNAKLSIDDNAAAIKLAKDVFCNGPAIDGEYSKSIQSQFQGLVKTGKETSKWKEDKGRKKIAEYLLGDCEVDHCHEKLGSLMSQRVRYDNSRRALHLGVIVRELADKKRYLLCLQPVCDSVRMGGKNQAFLFCVFDEPATGGPFTHCVLGVSGNVIQLRYKPKVSNIFVSNFKGNNDAVYANKDKENRFLFKDEGKKDYEWIAELKTEHAQRAAEQFGRELSRVGLTESEWLRIKAK